MSQWIFNLKLSEHVIRDDKDFLSRAEENDDSDLRVVMDQKAYLEEINRNLRWIWVFIDYTFCLRAQVMKDAVMFI